MISKVTEWEEARVRNRGNNPCIFRGRQHRHTSLGLGGQLAYKRVTVSQNKFSPSVILLENLVAL